MEHKLSITSCLFMKLFNLINYINDSKILHLLKLWDILLIKQNNILEVYLDKFQDGCKNLRVENLNSIAFTFNMRRK